MITQASSLSAALLFQILLLGGCDKHPATPTSTPTPTPPAAGPTLSGQVFALTPEGRIPAAGVPLTVNVISGHCPAIVCPGPPPYRITYRNTHTGADGRYSFEDLPSGVAALYSYSATHRQACGAFTWLTTSAQVDLEITSAGNPLPSPTMPPLRVSGQVYELTSAGRVPVANALVTFDWAYDSPFFQVQAASDGRYRACGIPADWDLRIGAWQEGYEEPFLQRRFTTDATLDVEMKRVQ